MDEFVKSIFLPSLLIACVTLASLTTVGDTGQPAMSSEDKCLVLASAENVREERGQVMTKLRIEHVYMGRIGSNEINFVYYSSMSSDGSGNIDIFPPLVAGERVLWLLDRSEDGGLRATTRIQLRIGWPVREKANSRYVCIKRLAEAIERFSSFSRQDERLTFLVASASGDVPEIAAWAVDMLAAEKVDNSAVLFEKLLETPSLTVSAFIGIDQWFATSKGDNWVQSEKRILLLGEKLRGKLSKYEADELLTRLDKANQVGELSDKQLHRLIKEMMRNENLPVSTRRQCVFLAGRACQKSGQVSEWFSLLSGALTDSQDAEIRYAAAHSIKNCAVPLSQSQKATLERIANETRDKKLSSILKNTLTKGAGRVSPSQ
jgi:hypothetical protein